MVPKIDQTKMFQFKRLPFFQKDFTICLLAVHVRGVRPYAEQPSTI
jgi:hypothetical protein